VIRLSRAARTQVSGLAKHYDERERPEAVRNLRACLASAAVRIEKHLGLFYPAPRPYPDLTRAGWVWLKEGPYWIAFVSDRRGSIIVAVFYEAADIPGRL